MDTQSKRENYQVVGAPGKFDLMNALFQGYFPEDKQENWSRWSVMFTVKHPSLGNFSIHGRLKKLERLYDPLQKNSYEDANMYEATVDIMEIQPYRSLHKVSGSIGVYSFRFSTRKRGGTLLDFPEDLLLEAYDPEEYRKTKLV